MKQNFPKKPKKDPREVTEFVEFVVNGIRVRHEYCDTTTGFSHRVAIGSKHGEWQAYQGMAEIEIVSANKRIFYGVTQYYSLPEVFEVIAGVKAS